MKRWQVVLVSVLVFFGVLAVVPSWAQFVMVALVIIALGQWATSKAESFGPPNPHVICPHCQTTGTVRTATREVKNGISGGKATGAVLTGGLSTVATGLSQKRKVNFARCDNCEVEWTM